MRQALLLALFKPKMNELDNSWYILLLMVENLKEYWLEDFGPNLLALIAYWSFCKKICNKTLVASLRFRL